MTQMREMKTSQRGSRDVDESQGAGFGDTIKVIAERAETKISAEELKPDAEKLLIAELQEAEGEVDVQAC